MNDPLLNLGRLWRDTRMLPDSDLQGYAEFHADSGDWDLLQTIGYHSIETLAHNECLFLLGRPGSGKTAEIKRIQQGKVPGFSDEWIVVIRCKEAGVDLLPEINHDPDWKAGMQQSKPIRLILDGLDEGFLREPSYFAKLGRTLKNVRSENPTLRLLLSCRPAEWDFNFGASLYQAWGLDGQPAIFALQPLSRENQQALVKHWKVTDTVDFSQWIRRNRFDEFAVWPRSLYWLGDHFRRSGDIDLSYTELCRLRVSHNFGDDQRRLEAGRVDRVEKWSHAIMLIAAAMVFCGKKGIALSGSVPECLTLDEIFRAIDRLEIPKRPSLIREDIREAVTHSHLMEQTGDYYRFENQSDLEFLAGGMLASLEKEQMSELLGCPNEKGDWMVFPQLATTAVNLAALSPNFLTHLLDHDPRVLLRMDFASKSDEIRSQAIEAIMNATAKIGSTGDHDAHAHFYTMRYPKITAQLQPWIFDSKQLVNVRELAYDIAKQCSASDLWLDFEKLSVAGDDFVMSKLPEIILHISKEWSEEKLLIWARETNVQIASAALSALLDRGWKPVEIIPFLEETRGDGFEMYPLLHRIVQECDAKDTPKILLIIQGWNRVSTIGSPFRDLMFTLIAKGLKALHVTKVREGLIGFLISRFKKYDLFLETENIKCGLDNKESRRDLLLAMAEYWPISDNHEAPSLEYRLPKSDYAWLLSEVAVAKGPAAITLGKFAARLMWQFDESVRESLEYAYEESPEFRSNMPKADTEGIFAALQKMRAESDARHQAQMKENEAKFKRAEYSYKVHQAAMLKACREGKLSAWTTLCFTLGHPKHEHDDSEFFRNTDPRQLAGWKEGSPELRNEMAEIARQFLLHVEFEAPGGNSIPESFIGLAYALTLHAENLADDHGLRIKVNPIWALALLRHYRSEDGPLDLPLRTLTKLAPKMVAAACLQEFEKQWNGNGPIYGQLLSAAWCLETENALSSVLAGSPLQPDAYLSGIALLAKHNKERAEHLAIERLAVKGQHMEDSPESRAAIAACFFVLPALWEKAWPYLVTDTKATRQFLLNYSRWLAFHGREDAIQQMGIPQIAALYKLLIGIFPVSEAPKHSGTFTPSDLDDAFSLRGFCQRILESRGATAELSTIYRECDETRQAWWARTSLDRATKTKHASRREPPKPTEFIRFLVTEGGTFVNDNDSLQRAVLASLHRFEEKLRPYGLVALWDHGKPRNEDALQVEIVRHLKHDFEERKIVVSLNMETKIIDEFSDIVVQTGPYSVTLEIKQAHSSDKKRPVTQAMRTQLATYLDNQRETHGIYVVGWYFCSAVDKKPPSKFPTLASARRHFKVQAQHLSKSKYTLAACVIDCRWPEKVSDRAHKTNSSRKTALSH